MASKHAICESCAPIWCNARRGNILSTQSKARERSRLRRIPPAIDGLGFPASWFWCLFWSITWRSITSRQRWVVLLNCFEASTLGKVRELRQCPATMIGLINDAFAEPAHATLSRGLQQSNGTEILWTTCLAKKTKWPRPHSSGGAQWCSTQALPRWCTTWEKSDAKCFQTIDGR